ncbi:hypothetical protein BST61_g9909 [Cercospora zeina]
MLLCGSCRFGWPGSSHRRFQSGVYLQFDFAASQLSHTHPTMAICPHNKPAFDSLFDVLELAEAIFLELSPQELLVSVQRVCSKWRDVVTASIPIQQVLFFRPIGIQGPLHFVNVPGEQYGGNWISSQGSRCPFQMYEHPLVAPLLLHEQQPSRAIDRPEASWRRQLLTQPPIRSKRSRRPTNNAIDVVNLTTLRQLKTRRQVQILLLTAEPRHVPSWLTTALLKCSEFGTDQI